MWLIEVNDAEKEAEWFRLSTPADTSSHSKKEALKMALQCANTS